MFVLHLCLYKYRSGVLFKPGSAVAYCNGLVTLVLLILSFRSSKVEEQTPPPPKLQINQHNTKTKLEGCRSGRCSPYNKLVFREVKKISVEINNTIYINSNTTQFSTRISYMSHSRPTHYLHICTVRLQPFKHRVKSHLPII